MNAINAVTLIVDDPSAVARRLSEALGWEVTQDYGAFAEVKAAGLRKVNQVIMVGGGERKAGAILAALRSGVVTTLVTDDQVAVHLLSKAATPGRSPRPRA